MNKRNENTPLLSNNSNEEKVNSTYTNQYTCILSGSPESSETSCSMDKRKQSLAAPRLMFPFYLQAKLFPHCLSPFLLALVDRVLDLSIKTITVLYATELGPSEKSAAVFGIMILSISYSLFLPFKKSKYAQPKSLFSKVAYTCGTLGVFMVFFVFALWSQKALILMNPKELELSKTFLSWSLLGIPPLYMANSSQNQELLGTLGLTHSNTHLSTAPKLCPTKMMSFMLQMVLFNHSIYGVYSLKFLAIPLFTVISNWLLIFQKVQEDPVVQLPPPALAAFYSQEGLNFMRGQVSILVNIQSWFLVQLSWYSLTAYQVDLVFYSIVYIMLWLLSSMTELYTLETASRQSKYLPLIFSCLFSAICILSIICN
ncbi:hypothetical protein DSO57_1029245 [Entomophthora muscae]|uniref:Uncharacterized protein n=1 Tax=Entomophthora muscae TaxID=34485 RepID=A0ACC2S3D0_9FUNG|nr:hypothetical protein DSO57_1029245 [Entomophthora muscae]